MAKWFTCQDDRVSGPYGTDELTSLGEQGGITPSTLVWGRPLEQWKNYSWWTQNNTDLLKTFTPSKDEQLWHYVVDEVSHGPLLRSELVEALKHVDNKASIMVWSSGMEDWLPLFKVYGLMEEVGISRREHLRVDIEGKVMVSIGGMTKIGDLKMISAGGCGFTGVEGLSVGEHIKFAIQSSEFYKPLSVNGEVRYIAASGLVGIKFESINSEERAAIINYVRGRTVGAAKAA